MKLRDVLREISLGNLTTKFNKIKSEKEYLNCQSFTQRLLDVVNIKSLPKLGKNIRLTKKGIQSIDVLEVGDILEFNDISHYAVYIGNSNVMEVEQWGSVPRIATLESVLKDYEGTSNIYRK